MPSASASPESSLRSIAVAVYLPILIYAIGEGAMIPFIVLRAQDLGASASLAGTIFALPGLAALVFSIPTGALIARLGSRRSAVIAGATALLGLGGVVLGRSVLVYAVSISVIGVGWAVWRLVRLDFVVATIGLEKRGRALAVMGGAQRIGRSIGPLLAAAVIVSMGLDGAFYLHILGALVAIGVFVTVPLTSTVRGSNHERPKIRGLAGEHRRSFGTAGVGLVILILLRSARPVVLPLWAVHIGLDPVAVGVMFGLSSAADAILFYPAGMVMDRFGRKWAGVPSMGVLALSFFLLPLTTGFATLLGVGLLMGVGNGISSGFGATLGSDLAPENGRAEFLGIWQMMANLGSMSGPLILGGIIAIASLGAASVTIGVVGVLGLVYVAFLVPETLVRSRG